MTAATGFSRGHLLLAGTVADLPAAALNDVVDAAGLLTRVDAKYLVRVADFERFVRALRSRYVALEIDGLRVFGYESVYFDTDSFALFHHHVQRRRRRFKVRTRTYLDSRQCQFEVKLKAGRGETVKCRTEHPFEDRGELTAASRSFLEELLDTRLHTTSPPLAPRIVTTYRRATLVDLQGGARVTCDVDLRCAQEGRRIDAEEPVIVESKTSDGHGVADVVLRAMGLRPVRLSKYCMAVALLNPDVPANAWNRTLRNHYGYRRQAGD